MHSTQSDALDKTLDLELDLATDPLLAGVPLHCGYRVLGGAALYAPLGRGGMGAVYRARHLELGIDVAVKCLLPSHATLHPQALRRFRREAAVAAELDHPAVVAVLGAGQKGGLHYLVMEYVHGENLRRRVQRRGPLPLGEALAIVRRAARGLAAAHAVGLVHRDVKPDNLMVGTAGEVKVCDLGLAKFRDSDAGPTVSASPVGTPRYMPPEQWSHAKGAGPQADVYGLGATLYFLLTGQDAIQAASLSQLHREVFDKPFPRLRDLRPELPQDVCDLVARCTAKRPEQRYSDCGALSEALKALGTQEDAVQLDSGVHRNAPLSFREPKAAQERALRRAVTPASTGGTHWFQGWVQERLISRTGLWIAAVVAAWCLGRASAAPAHHPDSDPAKMAQLQN